MEEPEVDEALKGEVGDKVLGGEDLHGGGTSVVAGLEPVLDAGAVVGDPRAQAHRGFHHLHGDGAPEGTRYGYGQLLPTHCRHN